MAKRIRWLLAVLFTMGAGSASALFHLWQMTELYSNADGSVQFLELTALTSSQQFLAGHRLVSTSGSLSRTFTFPDDLPGDSGGHRFLVGTAGFAALGIVQPDFVVPNNFFFRQGGTINFAESADVWSHGATPTDPNLSLTRNGGTATNSPTNFAGQTGRIQPQTQPAENYQALWWRSPAGSENGWGVNITHQADTLFATWFTYDTDGTGMWLVMSAGRKVADKRYTGELYRTTGPAFSSNPFNPAQVFATQVGTATFEFTDASNGTFTYTVNSVTQSKPITKQVFSNPVPTCVSGGSAGSSPNFQDLWWRAPAGSESGWGVNITHQGDTLFATWFTYDANGRGLWLVMSNGVRSAGSNTYTGDLFRTTGPPFNTANWNNAQFNFTDVGSATFAFTDALNGTFTYTVDGVTQSKPIVRQVFATPATACR